MPFDQEMDLDGMDYDHLWVLCNVFNCWCKLIPGYRFNVTPENI